MKALDSKKNFLGITNPALCSYTNARYVIQSIPYEYTSSYLLGSAKGPAAILSASHFVEFYDEELDQETITKTPIATLPPLSFKGKTNAKAIDYIEKETAKLIRDKKFVVSLGAEHSISLGLVRAHANVYKNISVLQFDAHSDLRESYHNNKYSHASVMARVNDLGIPITQVGIRAQCIEERQLIKSSKNIHTFYAHEIRNNNNWIRETVDSLNENVYVTIDADGFDPSVIPAVGTAEPNGLFWNETLELMKKVFREKNVIGFDIVECAPQKGQILSEYTLAKLAYRLIGYSSLKK